MDVGLDESRQGEDPEVYQTDVVRHTQRVALSVPGLCQQVSYGEHVVRQLSDER